MSDTLLKTGNTTLKNTAPDLKNLSLQCKEGRMPMVGIFKKEKTWLKYVRLPRLGDEMTKLSGKRGVEMMANL